jgi:fucose permease
VAHQPRRFYFHFIVSVGLCAANTLNLIAVFRFKSHEGIFGRDVTETEERTSSQKFKKLLSMSHTYLMALELLFYVGLEVTIGGWIVRMTEQSGQTKMANVGPLCHQVTYILEYRGGGTSSGYVATGFWGGMSHTPCKARDIANSNV